MCDWGTTVELDVLIPVDLSSTGKSRWATKPVDACIAPIVEALNKAGIYTRASCCGHGAKHGSIILHDGRELTVRDAIDCVLDDAGRCVHREPWRMYTKLENDIWVCSRCGRVAVTEAQARWSTP